MSLSGWILAVALSLLVAAVPALAAPTIHVEGLLTDAAILQVDGERVYKLNVAQIRIQP